MQFLQLREYIQIGVARQTVGSDADVDAPREELAERVRRMAECGVGSRADRDGLIRCQRGVTGEVVPVDDEQTLLMWLKAYQSSDPALPAIYLGYGTEDRFVTASEILAQRLPAARVAITPGRHDWETWTHLWEHLLNQGLFSGITTHDRPHAQTAANR